MKWFNLFKKFKPVYHVTVFRELGNAMTGDCEAHADDLVTAVAYADAIGRQHVNSGARDKVREGLQGMGVWDDPVLRVRVYEQAKRRGSEVVSEEVY